MGRTTVMYTVSRDEYRDHGRDTLVRTIIGRVGSDSATAAVAAYVETFKTNSRRRDALTTRVSLYPSGRQLTARTSLEYDETMWDSARRAQHEADERERVNAKVAAFLLERLEQRAQVQTLPPVAPVKASAERESRVEAGIARFDALRAAKAKAQAEQ